MKLEFVSRNPHSTRSLSIEYLKTEDPNPLIEDLKTIGWNPSPSIPSYNGIHEVELTKTGTGIFHSWKADEKKSFLKEIEKILKKHGHSNVPYRKLTFAECI